MDEGLSNEELLRRARPTRAERRIAAAGDPVIVLLVFLAWVLVLTCVPGGWWARLAFCLLASLAIPALLGPIPGLAANRRARRWILELERRCGRRRAGEYRDAYRRSPAPDEVACLFDGTALPAGGRHTARLVLGPGDPAASLLSATSETLCPGPVPWANVRFAVADVPEAVATELRRIVAAIRTGSPRVRPDPNVIIHDGFPADITIVPGDGGPLVAVSGNLDALADPPADEHERLLAGFAGLLEIRRWPEPASAVPDGGAAREARAEIEGA